MPVEATIRGSRLAVGVLALTLHAARPVAAAVWQAGGSLADVSVEVEGAATPLYPARDGSGRYYLEARPGCGYAVRVSNRSPARIGVLLSVDGLNAISGEREPGPSASAPPGRMYVIDPWDEVRVQGWRTSLDDVRRFTFVDERASYAVRAGRANPRMGWIEAWIYRERPGPRVSPARPEPWDRPTSEEAPPAASAPPPESAERGKTRSADGALRRSPETAESYPGTGWGPAAHDPATVVSFNPERRPSDAVTLRYEYARALRALGVLPGPLDRDRLRERERGDGFARPPAW